MKLTIHVKPNSSASEIEKADSGSLLARLKSAPVDGKANAELIRLLSKYFHVPQKAITIKHGLGGKKKTIEITV